MRIRDLLDEYQLSMDDVRWYLSKVMTDRLLSYREQPHELTRMIWSGVLGDELYDMEERFLKEHQERLDRDHADAASLRELFSEIDTARRERRS